DQLGIRVTDSNNDILFRIRKSTPLDSVMQAFCERQGKNINVVRFLFEGQRVQPTDSPDSLGIIDGDSLSVHQEQIRGFY
ncbi:ubiquitin family protein, partial [Truncatella angustata]